MLDTHDLAAAFRAIDHLPGHVMLAGQVSDYGDSFLDSVVAMATLQSRTVILSGPPVVVWRQYAGWVDGDSKLAESPAAIMFCQLALCSEDKMGGLVPSGLLVVAGQGTASDVIRRLERGNKIKMWRECVGDDGVTVRIYRKASEKRWENPYATIGPLNVSRAAHALVGSVIAHRTISHLPYSMEDMTGMSLLDYGCGTGRAAFALAPFFKRVYGWDPSPACILEARRLAYELGNRTKAEFCDKGEIPDKTDVVVSWNVVQHLSNPMQTIMDIAARARKYAIFSCRANQSLGLGKSKDGITVVSVPVWRLRKVLEKDAGA